jgi:branched-chain amino acid transport system ATP-binding protein
MLSVSNLSSGYGKKQILREVTLSVGAREMVSLMGRNGMGKTTTLRTLMGLTRAWSGRVEFFGKNISRLTPDAISRHGLGYVPEGRGIFANLTVYENLVIARAAAHGRWRGCTSCFRGCRSDARTGAISCRAASSRCCRLRARFCSTPR